MDSRRLFEIWETQLEILGILREMRTERQNKRAVAAARRVERGLAHKIGAAIDAEHSSQ